VDGLVSRTFVDAKEREEFRKSAVYSELHALVERKMQATGVAAGATPTKSGRFVVRLPKSLHAALEREAEAEGTSLNQLVVAKLAVQLSTLAEERVRPAGRAKAKQKPNSAARKADNLPSHRTRSGATKDVTGARRKKA